MAYSSGWCSTFIASGLGRVPLVRGMEDWLLDGSFALRGQRATSTHILLVSIDDGSLDERSSRPSFSAPSGRDRELIDHQGAAGSASTSLSQRFRPAGTPGRWRRRCDDDGIGHRAIAGLFRPNGRLTVDRWPLFQWQMKALDDPDPDGTDFGMVNLTEDGDQFVRRQQLAIRTGRRDVATSSGWHWSPKVASRRRLGLCAAIPCSAAA